MKSSLRVVLAFTPLFAAACSQATEASDVLRFTAIPDSNSTELQAKFEPLAAYLSEKLGVDIQYVPMRDYSASVEAFKNGDVHLAWFGGLTGVQARASVDGARAIAQGTVDPKFKSYFVAHVSTGIERSDEFPQVLEGKRFTFGSASSTSGRLMPEHFIRLNTGKDPVAFFGSENHYSSAHDATAKLVESGTFDAGAMNYLTYERMVAEGKLDPQVCRIVWVTPEYADYNWTAHPDLDTRFGEGFIGRLQKELVGLSDPALLRAIDRPDGLIPATNADFEGLRDLSVELGFVGP